MKVWIAILPLVAILAQETKEGATRRAGWVELALAVTGAAAFLFGLSFARGARDEREPKAERMGRRVFCGGGLALLSFARFLHHRER